MSEIKSRAVIFNRYQFLYLFCFIIGILLVLLDVYVFGEFGLFFILGVLMTVLYLVVIVNYRITQQPQLQLRKES